MAQSKDQQVKTVVVGLALGVLAQGVEAVTSGKTRLEFAFNHAWRRWPEAPIFPSIGGRDPRNLFWIGLGKSERRASCLRRVGKRTVVRPVCHPRGLDG